MRKYVANKQGLGLTLTGVDEFTDVAALGGITAEFGLLYSPTAQDKPRYPRWEFIRDVVSTLAYTALHVCGRGREEVLSGKLNLAPFGRVQVNGKLTEPELLRLHQLYPETRFIAQWNHKSGLDPSPVAIPPHRYALLIDGSGGRGKLPDNWLAPSSMRSVGFAGGLGPDNLEEQLPKILKNARPGWWIDMEQKLRDEEDRFCPDKCYQVHELFRKLAAPQPLPQIL